MKHHEAAALFPLLGGEAFAALVKDIKEQGQQEPIYRYRGAIIDGRNRLRACEKLGVRPWIEDLDPKEHPDPHALVMSLNYHRRHLSEQQSGRVMRSYRNALQAKNPKRSRGRPKTVTASEIGRLLGVPQRMVRRHIKAADDYDALPKELKREVDEGRLTPAVAVKVKEKVERRVERAKENGALPQQVVDIFEKGAAATKRTNSLTRWLQGVVSGFDAHAPFALQRRWAKREREILVRDLEIIQREASRWLKALR